MQIVHPETVLELHIKTHASLTVFKTTQESKMKTKHCLIWLWGTDLATQSHLVSSPSGLTTLEEHQGLFCFPFFIKLTCLQCFIIV
ncbi:hypothetical protein ACQP3J_29480, partial [Escherichia coli]